MKPRGFTLIEVLIFIIISSLLMSVMLLGANSSLKNAPSAHKQLVAIQSARKCMEWFLEQTRLYGYTKYSCPSTPAAGACTVPSGYSVTNTVSCTTWNSDSNYKTITVAVSGTASATLSVQIGEH